MSVRVLIISNEFCCGSSSNGRTLMNMLKGFKPENLAQFAIHGQVDQDFCSHSFKVSDKDALNAFLGRKPKKTPSSSSSHTKGQEKKVVARNYRNLVFRDIVWKSYRWWNKEFTGFIENFNPKIIIFQAGDSPFMFNIARRIAKKYALPIVMYNSENYVLKKQIYNSNEKNNFWHFLLQKFLKNEYKKMMDVASFCIYSTEYLEESYQKVYPHPNKSTTIYTVTDMQNCAINNESKPFSLLYCGNLGVGRVYPLDELAKTLAKVDTNAKLHVYGKFTDQESQQVLCQNKNVEYGGLIPYSELPEKIKQASIVVHAENPERLQNLMGAFSTKIADCLACGKPFLVYASRDYPFVKYLEKNNAAHVAENTKELENVLANCIADTEYRNKYLQNAQNLAKENHCLDKTSQKTQRILKTILQD